VTPFGSGHHGRQYPEKKNNIYMSVPRCHIRILYVAILPGSGQLLGQVLFFRVGLCGYLVPAVFPALAEQEERYTNPRRRFHRHLRFGVSSALEAGFFAGVPLDTCRSSAYRNMLYMAAIPVLHTGCYSLYNHPQSA
jgi:hypothetical protein